MKTSHTAHRVPTLLAALALACGATAASAAEISVDVPPAGKNFQIKTVVDGENYCVSQKTPPGQVDIYPLVKCNNSSAAQLWKRSASGRDIVNPATGRCLERKNLFQSATACRAPKPGPMKWKQDARNRVWKEAGGLERHYWYTQQYSDGLRMAFVTVNGGANSQYPGYFTFAPVP